MRHEISRCFPVRALFFFAYGAAALPAAASDAWVPTALTLPAQAVAIASSDSRVMVALGYGSSELFRTIDRGASWTTLPFPRSQALEGGVTGLVLARDVAIDPSDSSVIEVAALVEPLPPPEIRPDLGAVYRSTDGGSTWQVAGAPFPHPIDQVMFATGDSPSLYAAGAEQGRNGIYRSGDRGDSWEPAAGGLPSEIWGVALAADPSVPGRLYAPIFGSSADGLYRTDDAGATWSGPLFGYGSVSVAADSTVYSRAQTVSKSTDAGATWRPADRALPSDIQDVLPDPIRPNRLFIGSLRHGVFESSDSGESWTPFPSEGLPPPHIGGLAGLESPGYFLTVAPDASYLAAPSWAGVLIHPLPPLRRVTPVATRESSVVTRP